jgi:hypothetical protein
MHRMHPLPSRQAFIRRFLKHGLFALIFMVASLLVGIAGYHHYENLSYLDSLLNASMILGGMGPVGELHTSGGKLFASAYALFSGVFFLVIAGVLFAPLIHRFLHKFHLEVMDTGDDDNSAKRGAGAGKSSASARDRQSDGASSEDDH